MRNRLSPMTTAMDRKERAQRSNSVTPEKQENDMICEPNEKVKIIIRIRPTLNEESKQDFIGLIDYNTLKIMRPGNNMYMKFSNIFPQATNQEMVFDNIKDSILSVIDGINNTCFAYGQTGAGKTFTIIGRNEVDEKRNNVLRPLLEGSDRGILPRALELIISEMNKKSNEYSLWMSFMEVYNERVFDLLNPKGARESNHLEIRENKFGEVKIPELTHIMIENIEEAMNFLFYGLRNRVTGCTQENSQSSRSHCIFQIILSQKLETADQETFNQTSVLRIVDLAGSEKYKIPQEITKEERDLKIQELTSINGSLSSLGHCISALIQRSRTHIPFRNSKLTRVLSDSLSGKGRICFIVCVSPSITANSETFSTLQFANRAKKAILDGRNLKTPNKDNKSSSNKEQLQELTLAYAREKQLREQLEQLLKVQNKPDYSEQLQSLKQENECLKQQIVELRRSCHSYDVTPLTQTPNASEMKTHSDLSPHVMSRTSSYSNSNANGEGDSRRKRNLSNNEKKVRFMEDGLGENFMNMVRESDLNDKCEVSSRKSSASFSRNSEDNFSDKDVVKRMNKFWGEDVRDDNEELTLSKRYINKSVKDSSLLDSQKQKQKEYELKMAKFFAHSSPVKEKVFLPFREHEQKSLFKNSNLAGPRGELYVKDKLQDKLSSSEGFEINFEESSTFDHPEFVVKNKFSAKNSERCPAKKLNFENIKNAFSMVNENSVHQDQSVTSSLNESVLVNNGSKDVGPLPETTDFSTEGKGKITKELFPLQKKKPVTTILNNISCPNKSEIGNYVERLDKHELNPKTTKLNPVGRQNMLKAEFKEELDPNLMAKEFIKPDFLRKKSSDKTSRIDSIVQDLNKEVTHAFHQLSILKDEDKEFETNRRFINNNEENHFKNERKKEASIEFQEKRAKAPRRMF